ncbi:hypothetical protein P7K49_015843, partial [Saguinus oedipus]
DGFKSSSNEPTVGYKAATGWLPPLLLPSLHLLDMDLRRDTLINSKTLQGQNQQGESLGLPQEELGQPGKMGARMSSPPWSPMPRAVL